MVFILGACFGSFVNMWEYRLAIKYGHKKNMDKKVADDKFSYCDNCGKRLKIWENIPIISWLYLGGKTSCCHKKLPISYPIVELATGVLFVVYFNSFSFDLFGNAKLFLSLLIGLLMIVFLVLSATFDFKYMELPDFSTAVLVVGSIAINYLNHNLAWINLFAAIGACGFLLTLYVATKGKGMGIGDVKLAVFMGFLLGGQKTILAFYVAFIVGAIVGIGLMIFKKAKKNSVLPFGPYLILGTVMAWSCGNLVLNLIYKWF